MRKVGRGNDISFWYANCVEPQSLDELVSLDDDVRPYPNVKASEVIHNAQ